MQAHSDLVNTFLAGLSLKCDGATRTELSAGEWATQNSKISFNALNIIERGSSWVALDDKRYDLCAGDAVIIFKDCFVNRAFESGSGTLEVLWVALTVYPDFSKKDLLSIFRPPPCYSGETARKLQRLVRAIYQETNSGQSFKSLATASRILQIMSTVYNAPERDLIQPSAEFKLEFPGKKAHNEFQREQIFTVLEYIAGHYREKLTLEELADKACLSYSYFCRLFHDIVGTTPAKYLESYRISRAAELLLGTVRPVYEIAREAGYEDPYHFSRVFRRVKGVSPSAFRKI